MKPARLSPVVLVFALAARLILATLAAFVMSACQADPQSPSPSVSGESHFLSPCVASADCAAGLECLCGLCTVACVDDASCEPVESGAVCAVASACGAAGRTCARAPARADVAFDATCDGGSCGSIDARPAPDPDAGACGTVPRSLGLTLSPIPSGPVTGSIVSLEATPGALRYTIRDGTGAQTQYTLTGPFADLPADAAPTTGQVYIRMYGEAFLFEAGPCTWEPLRAMAGTWTELAPWLGAEPGPELACDPDAACPRDYARSFGYGETLRPGERRDMLTSTVTLGQNYGCPETPGSASRIEWLSVPRHDAAECAGDWSNRWNPAFELTVSLRPEALAAEPDLASDLDALFDCDVDVAAADGLELVPTDSMNPASVVAWAGITWHSTLPRPALRPPVRAHVRLQGYGWWQNLNVELWDAAGLALVAVDAQPNQAAEELTGVRLALAPPTCLTTRNRGLPDVWAAEGHPITVSDDGATATWLPGETEVTLAGRTFDLDVCSAHTWAETCSTDDPNGWLGFVMRRRE
jgi:hypothetical protein